MNTISYVHGASNTPLLGETIGQNLKRITDKHPEHEALVSVHQGFRATYRQFYDLTTKVAKALLAHNIQKGDRVGIWAPNCYEWVLMQYATARIGVILVNINPAYRAHEIEFAVNQSEIALIVSAPSFKSSDYRKIISLIFEDCPSLKEVVFLGEEWDIFLSDSDLITDNELAIIEDSVQFGEAVNIQYTSGTTGFPKGVTLTHHNILNNGYFIGKRLKYTTADRVCIPVPFYHCFGMVIGNLCCTSHGATIVIPNDGFDPAKTLQVVQDEKCTSLYGVPTMFIAELQLPNFKEYNLTSLRTGVMAGSLCPEQVMRRVKTEMHMEEVSICYGMTETSPVSTQTHIGIDITKQTTTVGTVQDHLEIKIIDPETGRIVPRGEAGELCTRGYSVMLKYWNNRTLTSEVLDENRWMHTGDLATMDNEGYISITGRIKDLIIRGGENISPKWIEDFLYTHPHIADVQVIGVPDEKYGEEIMAWVILKPGVSVTGDELKAFCNEKIAHFRIPKYWKFVTEFPMTISGKVRKVEMRQIAVEELGL
ncbi:fatty-acyl-CoA synthase [Myroides marinus]|uniref:Fatty-acyl-CoA synthase n=1 Tax=Myroides marinus TaxID=703342 RepID=A0A1H6SGG8_9FLAO|nr:AMP-binding protein [Myroides marinus]SEI63917.1 fatty-acyl-CoA synthase [Myroides marinus]